MARMWEIGSHKTTVRMSNGLLSVVYHRTEVVKTTPKSIILNSGGWKTATTKKRMNQASNQFGLGYNVYQKKGKWYVKKGRKVREFTGRKIILKR